MAFIKDLSTIADNIRREKDITNKMTIHDMATVLKPSLILVDWEGTILKYYDREEALALENFPAPSTFPKYTEIDHEYLVFTEWNWTIQEAKSWLGVHKSTPLIVGAIYDTVDQKNHYEYIEISNIDVLVSAKLHTNVFDNVDDPDYIEYTGAFGVLSLSSYFPLLFKSLSLSNNCTFPTKIVNEGTEDEKEVSLLILCCFLNLNIPRNITIIPIEAFWSGTYGEKAPCRIISLPATLKTIGTRAFRDAGLEYLSLPDEIESLSGEAIYGNSFKIFEFPNNELDLAYTLYSVNVEQDVLILPPLISSIVDAENHGPLTIKAIVIEGTPTLSEDIDFSSAGAAEEILLTFKAIAPYLKFYVPRTNLSWFESATNWCIIYNDFFEAIEDNIEYLESLGVNVDDYKGSEG